MKNGKEKETEHSSVKKMASSDIENMRMWVGAIGIGAEFPRSST